MSKDSLISLIQNSPQIDSSSKELLNTYLQQGFGSMTKHNFELLIYHLLANKTDLLKNKSTYEISNLLSLPESKVKNIQLESYLKYDHKNHKNCIDKIIVKIQEADIKPELDGNKIKFTLDNAILKREFEYAIKKSGYSVDHSFNKDIVSIKLISFISSLKMIDPKKAKSIENTTIELIKEAFKQEKKLLKEINKMSLPEIVKKHSKEPALNMAPILKLVLEALK